MLSTQQRTSTIMAADLTPATKLVLLHLLSVALPETYAATSSTAKIAAACGLTDRGVRKSLILLAADGLATDITTANRGDRTWCLDLLKVDTLPQAVKS